MVYLQVVRPTNQMDFVDPVLAGCNGVDSELGGGGVEEPMKVVNAEGPEAWKDALPEVYPCAVCDSTYEDRIQW